MSEEQLVEAAKAGDQEAISALYRKYDPIVRRVIRRVTRDYDAVQEARQQTWIRVWQKIHKFDNRSKFSTWVCQIAKNRAYTANEPQDGFMDIDLFKDELEDGKTPDSIYEEKQAEERMMAMMKETLKAKQYQALYLHCFTAMSREEIAEELGITVNALDQLLHRARENLRKGAGYAL